MSLIRKSIFLSVIASAAFGAFADAMDVLVSFNTVGPDLYADGTQVIDGEWYALVWSKDGVFEGFTSDCRASDANDAVVLMAPLAKGGHCGYTIFKIDSKDAGRYEGGKYAVYLLDTRNAEKSAAVSANAEGLPASVNGAVTMENYSAASAGAIATGLKPGNAAWGESVAKGDAKPKIAAFEVNGAKVRITVTGMEPSVKYNVRMGDEPGKLSAYALETPKGDVSTADFELEGTDAKFFQVVRQPLAVKKEAK